MHRQPTGLEGIMRCAGFSLAVAGALSIAAPAIACDGKNVLFQDNFSTANQAWGLYDKSAVTFGGGSLKVTPQPKHYAFVYYRGDVYEQADVCVDATIGGGSGLPDGDAGLLFGSEDYVGFYYFWISPKNGTAGVRLFSDSANKWLDPMAARKVQGLNANVGGKNTLRVTINGTRADAYLNGQKVVQLTIKPTKVGGFFGLAAGRYGDDLTWTFSNFKITDLP
jgi:hypothetical protein